ncbi:MAG: HAD family phosphatase [Ruminococcaceae bacterium]|nr:HAD family phosphatase [Oscillospiraceae bacterium]
MGIIPGAVLFDMDGTLFDSELATILCWETVVQAGCAKNIRDTLLRCLGITEEETRQVFQEVYGPDFPYDACLRRVRLLRRERYGGGRMPVKEGARALLTYFRRQGVPLAVASSTPTEEACLELEEGGLLPFFKAVAGGDRVEHGKPAPDVFLLAAAELGVDPADCWVIEDSFNGVRAACAAGMRTVMVPDLMAPDDEMRRLTAAILPTLTEVRSFFCRENNARRMRI